jgi:hypothetical protein
LGWWSAQFNDFKKVVIANTTNNLRGVKGITKRGSIVQARTLFHTQPTTEHDKQKHRTETHIKTNG